MDICIIGSSKGKEKYLNIIKKAEAIFDKVLYAPINGLRIEGKNENYNIFYKSARINEFDVVLPLIPYEHLSFGFAIIKIIEEFRKYSVISSDTIFHAQNPFLGFLHQRNLKTVRINTPRIILSISSDSVKNILSKLRYPVVMRTCGKKSRMIKFTSEQAIKSYIDTAEMLSQPIMIEELNGDDIRDLRVLKIGKSVYAISEETKEVFDVTFRLKNFVREIASKLNTQFLEVKITYGNTFMFLQRVYGTLNINSFEKAYSKDLTEKLLKECEKEAKNFYSLRMPIKFVEKIIDSITRW